MDEVDVYILFIQPLFPLLLRYRRLTVIYY